LLEYKGKKIMVRRILSSVNVPFRFKHVVWIQLDCGIHPGIEGRGSLPFWDGMERELDPSTIDLLLVTQCVDLFDVFRCRLRNDFD
jgi:Cft2 family RNA processing exonuclease